MTRSSRLEDVLPLSPLQEGLLFHALFDEHSVDVYTAQLVVDLQGSLDVHRLRAAAAALVQRHGCLRTGFVRDVGDPLQVVLWDVEVPWVEVDLTRWADDERDTELTRLLDEDRVTRFDMDKPPLVRFMVIKVGPDRHRLVMSNHHIVFDGWSTPLLMRDLFSLYASHGDATGLPAVRPYRDFLAWQSGQDRTVALDAWAQALHGVEGPTLLAADRRAGGAALPDRVVATVPPELTTRLTRLARTSGVTMNTLVQAGWGIVLARLTGCSDVVFGATVSGRPHQLPDVESMVGLFINTIPVRVRLDPAESVADLLARVQSEQTALLDHQYAGLAEIQRRIGVRELFDTLTVYESFPFDAASITAAQQAAGLRSTAVDRPIATHYPLTLMVSPEDGCLSLVLQYRPDVFDQAAVQTTADRLVRVLTEMVTSPDRAVSAVDVLSDHERRRLLVDWSDTGVQLPDASLPELFEAQVRRTPARTAVVCGDTALTYAELNAQANQLARYLIEAGIGAEHVVALVLPRSVEMIVAVLGVLKAGAAYLPIDPAYPDQRVRFMVADARPELLITSTGTAPAIPEIRSLVLDDPAMADGLAGHPATDASDHDRIQPLHPDNPAYIIYTSGSTGTPKGVLVAHHNVVALFAGTRRLFDFTEDDVWSLFHSYAFDFSVWELWGALVHGGRLVVISREAARSPADFLEVLRREAVTVLCQTPSAFYQLIEAEQEYPGGCAELALRTVVFGGEALDLSRLSAWYARHPDDAPRLVNMYGITETTVHVSHLSMNRDLAAAPNATRAASLIGAPLPGLRAHVLDSALGVAPIGVPGELYIGGGQLTRGYLGRAGLTATRFVAGPYGGAGERLYRTGDLARWTADGTLEFLGRADDQVKIRGFRIELGEVESVLAAHDGVAQAAVVARQDGPRGGYLAGYLVPVAGTGIDLAALREHLAAGLPEHMVPAAFVVLDALPLTSNGKLDRRALPAPDFADVVTSREPSTPFERVLSDLFAEVLGLERVGVDDSFFDLGGHSLLATRLVSRIRSARGVEVSIRSIFDSPTVAGLAAVLDSGTGDDVRPPLVRVDRPDPVPLSFAQQRLWFLYRLEGPSPTYNIPFAARLSGRLDAEALRSAVHDVVARHETLRTVFPDHAGTPYQRVLDVTEAPVVVTIDEIAEDRIADELAAAAGYRFELDREPPARFHLFRSGPHDHALCMVIHHIAGDEWSTAPLLADFAAAYRARCAGDPPRWSPLPVQYIDYTLWQRELLGTEGDRDSLAAAQAQYWTTALRGIPDELTLPVDRARPRASTHRGGTVYGALPVATFEGLQALGRDLGASEFMLVEAAVAVLLYKLGAGTDIPLGAPIAGRTDSALDHLVGFFVNTLVVRNDLSGNPTLAEVVSRVRNTALAGYAHQDLPFERLVEILNPQRSLSRHPLFQTMVVYQNRAGDPPDLDGVRITQINDRLDTAKFDLSFRFTEDFRFVDDVLDTEDAGLAIAINYSADLFDRATVESMLTWLLRVLTVMATAPRTPLHRVDVLSGAERHQLVDDFNDTAAVPDVTVPALFEQQVQRAPDDVAVVFEDVALTYAQLDNRAHQLACHLVKLGVGPEQVVGIHLERSIELIVALLGVLKAGAAFVPLEPVWPTSRIADIYSTSKLTAVLTTPGSRPQLPNDQDVHVVDCHEVITDAPEDIAANVSLDVHIEPDNLCYIIYTSGSTGKPKGAMIRQGAIAARLRWQAELLDFDSADAALFKAPLGFDISINEIFLPLVTGARLVVAGPGEERDVQRLLELIESQNVTFVYLVSSMLDVMLQLPDIHSITSSVKHLWCGGEVLTPELYGRFRKHLDAVMHHGYGPAETTVGVSHQMYRFGEFPAAITLGRPNPDSRIYVLDEYLNPVPAGVQGEIYVGGGVLGRGYVNDARQSAHRFVADPFSTAGERLYRTGDLGCWSTEGLLYFRGRADHQVKIRGMRVELQEVEAVLAEHEQVRQAVVTTFDAPSGLKYLAAFCTTDDPRAAAEDLREWLRSFVPEHMVPQMVNCVDEFPLLPSGKVDRSRLPEPDLGGISSAREPSDSTEEALCEFFAEVLGLERVGVDDSFFELGGHSMLATRLVSRIRSELGVELAVRTLFDTPTVAGLARTVNFGDTRVGETGEAFGSVLNLRATGDLPALYCIHPRLGLSWVYSGLLPYVERNRPVYGLQATQLDADTRESLSVESLAGYYARVITEFQHEGPYYLIGWSLGGNIAHAVACLLEQRGHEVPLLVLLDAYPEADEEDDDEELDVSRESRSRLYYRWLERTEYDVQALDPDQVTAGTVHRIAKESGGVFSGLTEADIERLVNNLLAISFIDTDVTPDVFGGDVLFFSALDEESARVGREKTSEWAPYLEGELVNHHIDFEHDDMMTPVSLRQIGPILGEYLRRCADRSG